jgi:membrane protein implicated in regulation of membrane protease activity
VAHPSTSERGSAILTLAYVAFSVLGCGYIFLSLFMGHGDSGDGAHAESAHAAADGPAHVDYGVDGGGHGSASAEASGAGTFHFPFFSPLALATLFAAVGAYGLIALHGFGTTDTSSLAIAIPAACATAYAVSYLGWRLISSSRGSSEIRLAELAGASAEVITPIPAGGIGEVAAIVRGQRFSGPARELHGREVPRGARVTVKEMVGTNLVVFKGEDRR